PSETSTRSASAPGRRVQELGSYPSSIVATTAVILIPAVSTPPTYPVPPPGRPTGAGVSVLFGIVTTMKPLPLLPPASLSRTAIDRNHRLRASGIDAVWQTGRTHAVVGQIGRASCRESWGRRGAGGGNDEAR